MCLDKDNGLQIEAGEAGHLSPVVSPPESPRSSAVTAAGKHQNAPLDNSSAPADPLADTRTGPPAATGPPHMQEGKALSDVSTS